MKRVKKVISTFLLALALIIVPVSTPLLNYETADAAAVKLNQSKLTVYTGNTYTLKLNGTSSKIKWSSSDTRIATVTSGGKVKGVKKGTASITAKAGTQSYKCTVTVKNPEISNKSVELQVAGVKKLSVLGAGGSVSWKSSDTSVVSVKSGGIVSAKSLGTAEITGTYKDKTYTCKVKVTDRTLHASVTDLTCSEDTQIIITDEGINEQDYVYSDIDNKSILDCEWGEWSGENGTLTIIPKKTGTTKITITSTNTEESLVIRVTVVNETRPKMKKLSAEQVYEKCSSATVQVNTDIGLGSGFFIEPGKVVTNYHVIEGATSINVQLQDGKSYDVNYILGYDKDLDIAILSVPINSDVLTVNQHELKSGETVYAIGSSLGLTDTFTNGIITNPKRYMYGGNYIQTNAAITNGNSGGPLLNSYGEVIGINTWQFTEGQNVNFAINISEMYRISTAKPITLEEYFDIYMKEFMEEMSDYFTKEDTAVSGDISTCQNVDSEEYVIGTINQESTDYYKFTLSENTIIALVGAPYSLNENDINNMSFSILDSTGNTVGTSKIITDDYYSPTLAIEQELAAGTYYISVKGNTSKEMYYLFSMYY